MHSVVGVYRKFKEQNARAEIKITVSKFFAALVEISLEPFVDQQ